MDAFSRHVLRVSVAQICQTVGWTSIHSTPLEILTDILQEYITGMAKIAAQYAMLFGQTEPNLHHVSLAFKDMNVSIPELEEFITYVESGAVLEVPKYPIPKESHLNFLKPGSREVLTRPPHIHEHLPPMHPHLEDQDYVINQSPLSVDVSTSDGVSPLSSPKNIFKKPGDPISSDLRRTRHYLEDETRPVREISSVMMTTSGFLSPAREGKLPEARTQPPLEFNDPPSPEPLSPQPEQQPQQQLPLPTQLVETKPEKKKRAKAIDAPSKKADKETKNKEELSADKSFEDEPKGKKLASTKETSKLKAFKAGALKMQQKPPSPSPPPQKKSKLSPNANQSNTTKQAKIKSPSKNDKRPLSPLIKDAASTSQKGLLVVSSNTDVDVDIKLPSEPDKQKLNIFKKITKVKEDHDESKTIPLELRESNLVPIDASTALPRKVVGASDSKDNYGSLDITVDVEGTTSASVHTDGTSENSGLSALGISKVLEGKKKRKDKQKEKRDIDKDNSHKSKFLEGISDNARTVTEGEIILPPEENKTTAVSISPSAVPASSSVPWYSPASYPSPIPPITISTSGYSLVTSKTPEDLPNTAVQPSTSSVTPDGNYSSTPILEENQITKKKEHKKDKKLKDKLKKKKDKKDKNKIKDKSERKKLKLEKKEKAKLKSRKEKKEKKKEKNTLGSRGFEQSHIPEDILNTLITGSAEVPPKKFKIEDKDESSAQVPKITLKLEPPLAKDTAEPTCPRKIVIKPIVKKEEVNTVVGSGSMDIPKAQAVTSKIKTHKGGKSNYLYKNEPPDKPPNLLFPATSLQEPTTVPKWEADPNQVWICPACSRPDDGSPMIACDICDLWFHWTCVGIIEAIESDWYCKKCISKRGDGQTEKKKKHRKKKN